MRVVSGLKDSHLRIILKAANGWQPSTLGSLRLAAFAPGNNPMNA
jgi:hypothetical protein